MSYNIDSFKIKKLENLVIPVEAFYKSERKDWHPQPPQFITPASDEVIIDNGNQSVTGILKDGMLHVTWMRLEGEGSGSYMHYVMNPALKESTGLMEAVLIWESGDSITRLTVKDGQIKEETIEL